MVRQDDVDAPGWPRAELCRELPVGLLGQVSHPPAQRLKVLRKGDAKVLGLDRTPRFVGRHLSSRRRTNEQTNEYRDWKAVRRRDMLARLPGRLAPSSLGSDRYRFADFSKA